MICSLDVPFENEGPGALAGASEAKSKRKEYFRGRYNDASISTTGKDRHQRAARMLEYCLALDAADAWQDCAAVWYVRLTPPELLTIAVSALRALAADTLSDEAKGRLLAGLTHDQRIEAGDLVADLADLMCIGNPTPPLISLMDEAGFWADLATRNELKAYCLATFNRMNPSDQAAFLGFVRGRAAE